MSNIVHVKVQDRVFNVPRSIMEKSNYFKNLPDYDSDNIELFNISPVLFDIFISEVTNISTIKKDLAELCDFLEYDDELDLIKEYYCRADDCNRITKNNKNNYCALHKCIAGCNNMKETEKYCRGCNCCVKGCDKLGSYGDVYKCCGEHKCAYEGCETWVCNETYCEYHDSYEKIEEHEWQYLSKCKIGGCNKVAFIDKYCGDHRCQKYECGRSIFNADNYRPWNNSDKNYKFCDYHKCITVDCYNCRLTLDYCLKCNPN